jgi:hypothetical protein
MGESCSTKEDREAARRGSSAESASARSNGDAPIRLTAEERRRLDALRKEIDPEILKKIDPLADAEQQPSTDRSKSHRPK